MKKLLRPLTDYGAVGFAVLASPILRTLASRRASLPRYQNMADKLRFQIRGTHYYEPTYSLDHLPADTTGERPLPGIDFNGPAQLALLEQFTFADELLAIPPVSPGEGQYGYNASMYGFGDAESYYSMIRVKRPRRIIEIGSGNSTLVALLAVEANRRDDPAYVCEITCIEPYEQPWLETTGVRVLRERVEHVAIETFDVLDANDILFIDSSHVIRPYGDVVREFNEIVPRLASGVLIQVHDIFTPREYPERWLRHERWLWNEQYLLEAFLAFNSRFSVICATNWLKHNHWEAFMKAFPMMAKNPGHEPGAFWFVAN